MEQHVGFGPLQIDPWDKLLKEIFEAFEPDTIEDIIFLFIKIGDDDSDLQVDSDFEKDFDEEEDDSFTLQQRFYMVLGGGDDTLRSAERLKNVMEIKKLYYGGKPMTDRVTEVISQIKEHQHQPQLKASEIFVGRDRDIKLILKLLRAQSDLIDNHADEGLALSGADEEHIPQNTERVKGVYISGIGGQGKTTLARKMCDILSEGPELWRTILVSLRNRLNFEDVLHALLTELDIKCPILTRRELERYLMEFIQSAKQKTLICLDDCDSVDKNSMQQIANILEKMDRLPTEVKFLMTSRSKFDDACLEKWGRYEVKLNGNLFELELNSLTDEEATDLLRRRSSIDTDELDEEKAHSIVKCCALSPLAITMVAKLLQKKKFTPQQLLFHLRKDEKHATKAMAVNICIKESFDKLDESLRDSIVQLTVFQSSKFDLKSAGKILESEEIDSRSVKVKETLLSLHDYHFLEVFEKFSKKGSQDLDVHCIEFSLHPLVYRFVAEKLKMGQLRNIYNVAVTRFVDYMEGKIARIYKLMSTKCMEGIAKMEENKAHILQYYDFLMDETIKPLLMKYPRTVKDKFVLRKKNVSDMTHLIIHHAKMRRLFLSEAKRAAETMCDAMEIFWMVEEADVLSKLQQKPDLALESLDKLAVGRFAALCNFYDQPDYPALVMGLYHKVKGQSYWKLLRYEEAKKHLCLSQHFYQLLPEDLHRVLKAKLLKSKGLLLLDRKELNEGEATLQEAYELLRDQVFVKEKNKNDNRNSKLKNLSLQIPEFFRHFGAIQIEKARLEKDPDAKSKYLNKALELLHEGIELDKQMHIDSLDDYAAKKKLCADVYIQQGLLNEAEKCADEAEHHRRDSLQLPHINVTESVYQMGKIYVMQGLAYLKKGNKNYGTRYLHCAEDMFRELKSDHLINGSIPTTDHPLYAAIKLDHIELYRRMNNRKKLKKLKHFYKDIETGKYDTTVKRFKDQFKSMMYTPQEVLDQLYGGGGEEFGDNDKVVIQVAAGGGNEATRNWADSGRGGSSIESSLSSVSEGGSLDDSISRMNLEKTRSLEDEVFHQANGSGSKRRVVKHQKIVSDD